MWHRDDIYTYIYIYVYIFSNELAVHAFLFKMQRTKKMQELLTAAKDYK